jgi:hypothetical protein
LKSDIVNPSSIAELTIDDRTTARPPSGTRPSDLNPQSSIGDQSIANHLDLRQFQCADPPPTGSSIIRTAAARSGCGDA